MSYPRYIEADRSKCCLLLPQNVAQVAECCHAEGDGAVDVRDAAKRLADAEHDRDLEYLRLIATGENPFVANRQADLTYGRAVVLARAEYEIALARLRR